MNNDKPTELTQEDFVKCVEMLMNCSEIKLHICRKCKNEHFPNYGESAGMCDECWFARFPKEIVEKFYRSFFE